MLVRQGGREEVSSSVNSVNLHRWLDHHPNGLVCMQKPRKRAQAMHAKTACAVRTSLRVKATRELAAARIQRSIVLVEARAHAAATIHAHAAVTRQKKQQACEGNQVCYVFARRRRSPRERVAGRARCYTSLDRRLEARATGRRTVALEGSARGRLQRGGALHEHAVCVVPSGKKKRRPRTGGVEQPQGATRRAPRIPPRVGRGSADGAAPRARAWPELWVRPSAHHGRNTSLTTCITPRSLKARSSARTTGELIRYSRSLCRRGATPARGVIIHGQARALAT